MKIKNVTPIICNGGWRPWIFIKIESSDGIIGYSEITDSHGSIKGLISSIEELGENITGDNCLNINSILQKLYSKTQQTPYGLLQKSIGGIENALWDIKGKVLNKPVYEILGGNLRDSLEIYWSHCGTTRVRASHHINKKKISSFKDLEEFCVKELSESKINLFKTNLLMLDDNKNKIHMPGFNFKFNQPDRNLTFDIKRQIAKTLEIFNKNIPKNKNLLIDLNFNFNFSGLKEVIRLLNEKELYWIEVDSHNFETIKRLSQISKNLIASGENLYKLDQYYRFLSEKSCDVIIIDVIWNGLTESLKVAKLANYFDIPIAPHNYYTHLSTFISLQFCSIINNVKIMEIDIDDVPWKDQIVDEVPEIKDGKIFLNNKPGWGVNLREKEIEKHKWSG